MKNNPLDRPAPGESRGQEHLENSRAEGYFDGWVNRLSEEREKGGAWYAADGRGTDTQRYRKGYDAIDWTK